jgi:NMD protein affecting ribosome stability and mRNA decay
MGKFQARKCVVCGNQIDFRYKAMPEWRIVGDLCGECYEKKLTDHYIAIDRRDITKR